MNTPRSVGWGVDHEWLALRTEEALEPDLPIIDAHFHTWDRPGFRYLLSECLEDMDTGHNIIGSVFVECDAMYRDYGPEELRPVGETEFANGFAAMFASGQYGPRRISAGIVGWADMMSGQAVTPVLEAHIAAAPERFRGIRYVTLSDPAPELQLYKKLPAGLLGEAKFREAFACLAPLNLSFDACLYHTQIGELAALARAFPETTIILDHSGLPLGVGPYAGRRDEVFADWKAGMVELGACPNAYVKLGGFGTQFVGFDFASKAVPPSSQELAEAWRPYVETCIEAFGTKRCMFESDFPVDKLGFSFPIGWNAFKRITQGASDSEKADLYSGAAITAYRLTNLA